MVDADGFHIITYIPANYSYWFKQFEPVLCQIQKNNQQTIQCGQKILERWSSSNAAARDSKERVQNQLASQELFTRIFIQSSC